MNDQLYSLQAEKHVLSGLIKYPDLFFEIDQHYTDDIFYSDVHKTIFNVIKTFIIKGSRQKNDTLDPVIIGQKVKDLGIKFKDDIDIIEYLSTFSLIQVSQKAVKHAAEELEKLKVCRDIIKTGEKIIKQVKTVGDKSIEEIVDNVDRIYSETVKLKSVKNKPQKLLINTIEIIEERAKKPLEEIGLITPHKEFNLKFGGLRPGNIYAFVARPKEGKALEENTPILTSKGWKPIKNVYKGDQVFSIDGSLTTVTNTYIWPDRKCFYVKTTNGDTVIADESHEWVVRLDRRKQDEWETLETKQIYNFIQKKKEHRKIKLPSIQPLQFPHKDNLLINPYVLGLWLGDGNSVSSHIYAEKQDALFYQNKLNKLGEQFILNNNVKFKCFIPKLVTKLKQLNLFKNKHIPKEYLFTSIEQRTELLKGLMDTDGYINPKGQAEFCSCNKQLADDFLELLNTLGIKSSIKISNAKLYGRVVNTRYRIKFYHTNCVDLPRKKAFLKKKLIKPNKYIEIIPCEKLYNTVCIEVDHPSKLFLCGKGLLPTHNSTFLTDTVIKCTQLNPKCKGLILDTEMETKDINFRLASALSNIPSWWLETGNWIKKPEYVEAWKAAKEIIKIQRPVEHLHVAGKPISEIKSLIRRWYYENVDVSNGETAIIDYDYIKMTGESSADMKEWQIIGDKINTFKELSVELNIPIVTACQLNRDGARGINSTASIAMSDRLTWFATFVGIFRKKTPEEIIVDGNDFGSHILDPLVFRFEGREAFGHMDLIRVQEPDDEQPRYIKNMFHFNVTNFNVTECGTTKDLYNRRRLQIEQGRMPEEEINF